MAERYKPNTSLSRPTKRPRLSAMKPDGFDISPPKAQAPNARQRVYKPPSNLVFESAFDDDLGTVASSKRHRSPRASRPKMPLFPQHGNDCEANPAKPPVRPLKQPIFSTPQRLKLPDTNPNPNHKSLKKLQPIALDSIAKPEASVSTPKSKPILRPAPSPPPRPHPRLKPQPVLKALHPPPLPKGKEKETPSDLRTISTTDIARATDLASEAGPANVLSIFLQSGSNLPEMVGDETREVESEVRRGVGVSPVKNGGKRRGFVRNGLAERAKILLAHSQTAHTLWATEIQRSRSSSRRPKADLQLRVLKILHKTEPRLLSKSLVIALCRVVSLGEEDKATWASEGDIPVLFSEHNTKPDLEMEVEEGKEVFVCKPFFFVDLSEPLVISTNASERMSTGLTQFDTGAGLKKMGLSGNGKRVLLCFRYFLR